MKKCARCSHEKSTAEFYRDGKRPDGLRPWCKACCNSDNRKRAERDPEKHHKLARNRANAWYARNPEHAAALARTRYATMSETQKDKRRARGKRHKTNWRNANRDASRELARIGTRKWRERHPERADESSRRNASNRRAWKRFGADKITASQWEQIVNIFGGVCAYCKKALRLGMDHFVPLSRGGRHVISNLVPCCRSCNCSKNNSDPFEWMESRSIDGDVVVALICETRHVVAA
jgi:5-methylcytosine-specific restriction endonuclease McrA